MRKVIVPIALGLVIFVTTSPLATSETQKTDTSRQVVADTNRIEQLHTQHCSGCHINITDGDGSVIYTRSDRMATDQDQLMGWVRHFADGLSLEWTEQDMLKMTEYINQSYYGFEAP